MKKKFILLMMMCLLGLFSSPLKAQEPVEIGTSDGTPTGLYPIYGSWSYSESQQLFTAGEIGQTGKISEIAFKTSTAAKDHNVTIYLLNTTVENLSTPLSYSDSDKVFEGAWNTCNVDEWAPITLDNVFEYDGDNLVVIVKENGTGTTDKFHKYTKDNGKKTLCYKYSSSSSGLESNSSYYTSTYNNVFRITFAADDCTEAPNAPTNLVATANDHASITLTWDAVEGAKKYNVYMNGNNEAITTTGNTYTVSGLSSETTYSFTVTAVCGAYESDPSASATATTLVDPFAGKQFRIKVANGSYAGYYLNVNSHEITDPYSYYEPDDAATRVGVSTFADNNLQIFTITTNGNGQYYLCDADGYLIKCDDRSNYKGRNTWDIDAYSTTIGTPLMFDYVDGEQFYIRDYDKYVGNGSSANYSTTNNYFKVQDGLVYCDAPKDLNNGENHRTVLWTIEELQPSVELSVSTVDLGDVRMGDYWSEKETVSQEVEVNVVSTQVTNITCSNDFFTLSQIEFPVSGKFTLEVGYNKNAEVTGEQSGTITITSADCDPITVTVTATAYTATEPDAIEAYTTIAFTDGEYTNTPTFTNLHDDYVLPNEATDGNAPDAVYKFTMENEGLLTVNVTGTNGIAAIYKAEDLEGNGPSADNNYEGVQAGPSGPTTFFYDFEDGSLDDFEFVEYDANNNHWQYTEDYYGRKCIVSYSYLHETSAYIGSADNYIYTKDKYVITADSKLSFDTRYYSSTYPDKVMVKVSSDGQEFKLIETVNPNTTEWTSKVVDLGAKFAELGIEYGEYHIALHHQETYMERIFIDNLELSDGSSKTREGDPQINGGVYPAGTYYLVAAAEDEFTVTLSAETVPAPAAFAYTSPENNAMEQVNPKLTWEASEYATSYKVYLGTELPLTEYVEVEELSYQTENLQNNTKYYWSVTAVNETGETVGEVYSFVTPLNQVTELAATATNLYPGEETTISWTAAEGATGYNVYVNDVKVNEEPVTETSYTLSNLAYNMNPGNAIAVTAVHALGESPKCEAVYVKVAGEFTLVVNVKDAEGNALEGAAVAFNTESYYDEYYQLVPAVETLYTDANGQITQVLPLPCVYDYYVNPIYASMDVTISKEYANNSYIYINSYTELTNGEEYVQNVTLQYVAPQTIQLDDYYNQYVVGEEMTMTWDAVDGAIGYNVYEGGEWNDETSAFDYTLLTTESLTEETFTVELTEYDPYGLVYAVAAVYSFGESPKTEKNVYVTGKSQISAVVKDANDEALKGAIVTLVGKDDFGNNKTYGFTTDANGAIAEEDVLVGTYTATISHYDYEDYITNEFIIEYGTPYNLGTITLTARAEATIAVTATEAADGSKVDVSWEAEYEKYNVYRRNVETEEYVQLASDVTLNEYEATDWAALENGTYQYGVSGLSEVGLPAETFSGTTIPEGWQIAGAYQTWWTFDGNTASVTKDENTGANVMELISPMINLNGINSPQVTYQYKSGSQYWSNQYTSTVIVSASESLDGPWTELDRDTYDKGSTNDFVTRVVSLTAFEGKSIYVKFGTTTYFSSTYFDNIVFPQGSTNTKPVWSEPIEKVVVEFTNAAEDNNWHNAANWSTGSVPTAENNVVISAAAVISSQDAVAKNITIASGASVTVSAERTLTAQNIYNTGYAHSQLIINDGAQVIQNNEGVLATFNMGIVNPETWGVSSDGWQFIAVPFTDAAFVNFTGFMATNYDLFKYDGEAEDEWQNHKDNVGFGDAGFVNGRAYLASHENKETASIYGTLNSANTHEWTVSYNSEKDLANYHLLGNPFSFDMDWSNIAVEGVYNGFATVNSVDGSYDYFTEGTVNVGDGFFVRATAENPTISYGASKGERGKGEKLESINLIATGANGDDNAIINFADSDNEGFLKLDNINTEIANIYFSNSGKRYAISNFDREITEIPVSFDAKQMGNYTIAAQPQGKFESVILVDRFTGVETNLLLEDYNFTSTGDENHDRFIVKLVNGQQTTDNSHFAYVLGEELILNVEGSVQIIDVMGRVIYANDVTSDNNRINVSNFDNAAYVIRVINENGVKVQKIIL